MTGPASGDSGISNLPGAALAGRFLAGRALEVYRLLALAVKNFIAHDGLQTGAALAYYALLSLAPLLLTVVSLASIFFSEETVRLELLSQIERLIGSDGAGLADTVLTNAAQERNEGFALTIGTLLSFIGASTVFAQLQNALNRIWGVKAAPHRAWLGFLRHRVLSLALVLTIGFLLLVSLVFDAVLAALISLWQSADEETLMMVAINLVSTFAFATVLLVLILKLLPDAKIAWRNVWLGAAATTILFALGKSAISTYLGQAGVGSWFGAAGSVVVFMVWIFYASVVFLFGACMTRAVATIREERTQPSEHARESESRLNAVEENITQGRTE